MLAHPVAAPLLEVVDLERRYQRHRVWSNLSFTLTAGEVVLVIGPNGAGKSTLLRTVSGLIRPHRGTVLLNGRNLQSDPAVRSELGYLAHTTALYRDLTALENLRFAMALQGRPIEEEELIRALRQVGLEQRAEERVGRFSRGLAQRLALARVRLHRPHLLLLDEPFTGLDQPGTMLLQEIIQQERERGTAVLAVTHDPAELWEAATRLFILGQQRLLADLPRPATLAEIPVLSRVAA